MRNLNAMRGEYGDEKDEVGKYVLALILPTNNNCLTRI